MRRALLKAFMVIACLGVASAAKAYDPVEAVMQGGDADINQFTNTPSFPTGMEINGAFYNSYGNFSFDSFVPNSQIDGSSITKQGNTFNGPNQLLQLTNVGLIPNNLINNSSFTLQGNTFNGANQLLQLNSSAVIPNSQIDSSSVTKLGNGNISFQGRTTNTFQPSFLAFDSTNQNNVTGNGTLATVTFDTKVYDQTNNFSANIFTAPVTGHYLLSAQVKLKDAGGTPCEARLVTTNRTYSEESENNSAIFRNFTFSVIADMNTSDTAQVQVICSGGSLVIDVVGNGGTTTGVGAPTYFSGTLLN